MSKPKSPGFFYGNAYAIAEGWALIQLPNGQWAVRAIKDRGVFKSHEAARAFVDSRANEHHAAYYHDAIAIIEEENEKETAR